MSGDRIEVGVGVGVSAGAGAGAGVGVGAGAMARPWRSDPDAARVHGEEGQTVRYIGAIPASLVASMNRVIGTLVRVAR